MIVQYIFKRKTQNDQIKIKLEDKKWQHLTGKIQQRMQSVTKYVWLLRETNKQTKNTKRSIKFVVTNVCAIADTLIKEKEEFFSVNYMQMQNQAWI